MRKVLVLNGPNLKRLGSREPEIYGQLDYNALVSLVNAKALELDIEVDVRQTDSESELISWIHEAVDSKSHVVLNPAAFTHYSYALRDAAVEIVQSGQSLIEVHISNPSAREEFRHKSVITGVATGVIAGFGLDSYVLALTQLSK
jgi:3-dehydroquinate dehydratase-2